MEIPYDILQKIERYCAYQERCSFDVRKKLKTLSVPDNLIDTVINKLTDENFLNEERFVEVFVRSKVKAAWGKQKICAALKMKQIPDYLISEHLSNIDNEDYSERITAVIEKWRNTHKDAPKDKLIRHLMSKGYSYNDISKLI